MCLYLLLLINIQILIDQKSLINQNLSLLFCTLDFGSSEEVDDVELINFIPLKKIVLKEKRLFE